mmetsp:Transcript_33275/g.99002  ORF Transcript_33275/g.99002 Transcript_33275/m.99002 type:complete len:117 (-) Transcript_33275:2024-2374(-)
MRLRISATELSDTFLFCVMITITRNPKLFPELQYHAPIKLSAPSPAEVEGVELPDLVPVKAGALPVAVLPVLGTLAVRPPAEGALVIGVRTCDQSTLSRVSDGGDLYRRLANVKEL